MIAPAGRRAPGRVGRRVTVLAAVLAATAGSAPGPARAADDPAIRTAGPPAAVRATLSPSFVRIGQPVLYRAWIRGDRGSVRWLPPAPDDRLTWGTVTVRTRRGGWKSRVAVPAEGRYPLFDTVFVEVRLQAFELGRLAVSGPRVEVDDGSGPRVFALPAVTLDVVGTLSAADSNADFRPMHGPLAAPWWERVPWRWVALGVLALAALATLLLARRRRRLATGPAAPRQALDPLAEALAALAALRALGLPDHGRFAEHAFRLGQILRRYLEAVTGTTRPGDTTPELVHHLAQAGLDPADLSLLAGMLRAWDRVKFAREPLTLEEALRAERVLETFLRRPAPPAVERVA